MKQKDIATIMIVVFVSAVISIFASKALFATPANRQQQVQVVKPITANFPPPDTAYFNSGSIDPTILITIGNDPNTNPFSNPNPSP